MSKILCRFGFHNVVWEKPTSESWRRLTEVNYHDQWEKYERDVQYGTCSSCGKSFKRFLS